MVCFYFNFSRKIENIFFFLNIQLSPSNGLRINSQLLYDFHPKIEFCLGFFLCKKKKKHKKHTQKGMQTKIEKIEKTPKTLQQFAMENWIW